MGVPRSVDNISIHTLPLHFDKRIIEPHGGNGVHNIEIYRYLKLYKVGVFKLKELITHRFCLEQIYEAIARIRNGKVSGRSLIKM